MVEKNIRTNDQNLFTNSIWKHFEEVEDPRAEDNQKYRFKDLLIMIICAVICGANEITSIVNYIESKLGWFNKRLGISDAPSYKTIWWLLALINPKELQQAFVSFVTEMKQILSMSKQELEEPEVINVDGKTSRGTKRDNIKALHIVSAWSNSFQLLLGQVKTDVKSNEITAIPELLKILSLENSIVTIDAMGCQTAIAEQIIDGGGDYILALKGNQETIHEEVKAVFEESKIQEGGNIDYVPLRFETAKEIEKGHGRIEERIVRVCDDVKWLQDDKKWKGIETIIEVFSKRTIGGRTSEEKRYYISSVKGNASQFLKWIRDHWGVESMHWMLDVTFKDDDFQGHTAHIAENIAILKRLTLNLLKQDDLKKSMPKKRERAGWDNNYLLKLLGV